MKSRNSAGYTILEVLIVLTVTIVLFLSVTVMFSGQQGKAEMEQSVRELESSIQNVANEVANGFYPNNFRCQAPGVGPVNFPAGAATPGGNEGCIFLGKVMAFNGTLDGFTISVLGRQYVANSKTAVSSYIEALPLGVSTGGSTRTFPYKSGLTITGITRLGTNAPVGALAFMTQLSGGVGASGNPLTGARTTLLYTITGTSTPNPPAATPAVIATRVSIANLVPLPTGVTVCIKAGRGQRAELTVGDNNNQTSTFVKLNTGINLACPTP